MLETLLYLAENETPVDGEHDFPIADDGTNVSLADYEEGKIAIVRLKTNKATTVQPLSTPPQTR